MSVSSAGAAVPAGPLDRERIVAGPRFNRWLVPPAALAIYLCIGMAYGFSVFWLPMTRLLPGANAEACKIQSFFDVLVSTSATGASRRDAHFRDLYCPAWHLGCHLGRLAEHAGPRKAGLIAALCWGGGLVIGGFGVSIHQLWLVYLGCGLIGGIGQGLGYITPVSTLINGSPTGAAWRRGLPSWGLAAVPWWARRWRCG